MTIAIRPAYRWGRFVGFTLFATKPIGKAFAQYKLAALALRSLS